MQCRDFTEWLDDNHLFHEWFTKVFIPYATARNTSGKPILLILDNHSSHISFEMINTVYDNNILLFCFLSKTTHKLQPLDVVVFSPLQQAWAKQSEAAVATNNTIITSTVVHEYMKLRDAAMKESTVLAAFHETGISPLSKLLLVSRFQPQHKHINPCTCPTIISMIYSILL